MNSKIKWVGLGPAKFNEDLTQLSLGFEVEGEEKLRYLNLPIAGGSSGQTKYAAMMIQRLLKGSTHTIQIKTNERGYDEVEVLDQAEAVTANPFDGDGF